MATKNKNRPSPIDERFFRNAFRPSVCEPIERQLPNNIDAERSILGAILIDNNALNSAIEKLKPEDFFHDHHRRIYRQMIALGEAKQAIDLVTLTEQMHRTGELETIGGAAYVSELMDGVPHITNVEHYARIVKGKSLLRGLIYATHAIQQQAFDAESAIDMILDQAEKSISDIKAARGTFIDWRKQFHTVDELPHGEIDFLVEGILPAGVTFIGGLSAAGKTWFALSLARALTKGKKFLGIWAVPLIAPVLYLCPEMNGKTFRLRCQRFGIGSLFYCQTIDDGAPLDLSDPLLAAAVRDLSPVVFLDTAIRFSEAEEENSAIQNAQGMAKSIFRILHLGARAVVCLHHRAKVNADAKEMTLENVLRGTGDLGAMCDSVWGLEYDRGSGDPQYLKQSRDLVRLHVRCVKARDFRTPADFRVQLDPYLDELGDMAVLADDSEAPRDSEVKRLCDAIQENPTATKMQLQEITGIGRNRIQRLAKKGGWRYTRNSGWERAL